MSMSSLLYIEYRQFVNLMRLTLRTPKRLIPVILFCLWLLPTVGMSLLRGDPGSSPVMLGLNLRLDAIHVGLYLVFALAGLYLIQRSFSESLIAFSMPEIDMVVTTPIPRWQFMALKLAKIYIKTGAAYAFLMLFLTPTIVMAIGRWSVRSTPIAWAAVVLYGVLLINVCTIINLTVQYASSGSGLRIRTLIRVAAYGLLFFAALTVGIGYLRTGHAVEAIAALLRNPLFVALMLPAAWASNLAMVPAVGWVPRLGLHLASLGVLAGVSYVLVLRRRENPYEPSLQMSMRLAVMRLARRSGGLGVLPAETWKRRSGSLRRMYVRPFGRGASAVFWKNLIVGLRLWRNSIIAMGIVTGVGMFVLRVLADSGTFRLSPGMILGGMLYLVWIETTVMLNVLRRDLQQADIMKPMPIPAWRLMLAQTGHVGLLNMGLVWLIAGSAMVFGVVPAQPMFVYAALALPFVAYASICAQLIAVVLYPNIQDLSQQYIGGLLSMLLSGVAMGPPAVIGLLFWYLKLPLAIGAALAVFVSLAISGAGVAAGAVVYRRRDPID